jgi:RNA polymerase sigma-70 factor (ECF subfamily)
VNGTAANHSCESDAELEARFIRDGIPALKSLFGYAMQLTRNHTDAEDLLQEATIKAYKGFRSFSPGTNLTAWLARIICNTVIDTHRRSQRQPREQLVDDLFDWYSPIDQLLMPGVRSAEADVLGDLPGSRMVKALSSLSDDDRFVLYYFDIEGYAYSEIATFLRIPTGTVASRLYNARRKLRRALGSSSPTDIARSA